MIHLKLKQLRKEKGLTQLQVADALHKSQNAYSLIENGQSKLDADLIPKICSLYDINPNDFYNFTDNQFRKNKIAYLRIIKLLKDELYMRNNIIQKLIESEQERINLEENNRNIIILLNMAAQRLKLNN